MEDDVIILDGGFASQLSTIVDGVHSDPLWSSRALKTDPKAVVATHEEFLKNDADIVTTASYQASVEGFVDHFNVSEEDAKDIMKQSVTLARQACDKFNKRHVRGLSCPLVAGSLGPRGACLCDGSEYTGKYIDSMTEEQLAEWHLPRIEALVAARVDVLALETCPALKEAEAVLKLLRTTYPEIKVWVSFSCQDDKTTPYGEDFGVAARTCVSLAGDQLLAVGVNCLSPVHVTSLLKCAGPLEVPYVVYPNSGETWIPGSGWNGIRECPPISEYVSEWLDLGVRYVGGCCRVYPEEISEIKKEVEEWTAKRGVII